MTRGLRVTHWQGLVQDHVNRLENRLALAEEASALDKQNKKRPEMRSKSSVFPEALNLQPF